MSFFGVSHRPDSQRSDFVIVRCSAVYSTPAEEKLDSVSHSNVEQPLPTSDGLGPLQPGDEDFAAIHSRWATKYFQSSLSNPKTWVSLVTCGVLMSEYCYENAKWLEVRSLFSNQPWHPLVLTSSFLVCAGLELGWSSKSVRTSLRLCSGLHADQCPVTLINAL